MVISEKLYTPIPVGTLIGSIILAYFLDKHLPLIEIVPAPYNRSGWILVAIGIVSLFISLYTHISSKTTILPGEKPSTLITRGLFRFSRNPIYVMDVIIATGVAVILGSLIAFIAPLLCFLVLNFLVIPFEEKNLRNRFGKEYENYTNRVRRWI